MWRWGVGSSVRGWGDGVCGVWGEWDVLMYTV